MAKITTVVVAAVALSLSSSAVLAKEDPHRRFIPDRPDRQSIRKMITEMHDRRDETLTKLIERRQRAIDDHHAGRALLGDEGLEYHVRHVEGLRRKLALSGHKDPATRALEIENEIEMHEKMLLGEFVWTPNELDLVMRDPDGEFARSQLGLPIEFRGEDEQDE